MKILFLSNKYPPYVGGAQTQLQVLAKKLAETNEVHVAILSTGQERLRLSSRLFTHLSKNKNLHKSANECLSTEKNNFYDGRAKVSTLRPSLFEKLRIYTSKGKEINKIMEPMLINLMKRVDIVHCLKPDWLAFVGREAARKVDVPFAIAPYLHHSSPSTKTKTLLENSDIVFALTEADKKNLAGIGIPAEKIKLMGVVPLVPTGGNAARFRESYGFGDDPIVLFVGRMSAYKGVSAILKAAPLVLQMCTTARFVFIGPHEGGSDVWFENADKRIVCLGPVSEEEKADALAACDIFCMPSLKEILPAVYLEAWTYGKPVIGGTAYGLRELIEDNGAGLIASQDNQYLAGTITKMLRDKEARCNMGKAGKSFVERHYSTETIAKRMLSAYAEAIINRSRRCGSAAP